SAHAATVNWIGAAGDSYTNKAAWSTGVVPSTTNDTAAIGNATVLSGSVVYTNAQSDPASTNVLGQLLLGNAANASGTFTMNSGTLSITNGNGSTLVPGNASATLGTFIMNGGVLTCVRTSSTMFQDSFLPGSATNSTGNFILNNGTAT